MKTTTIFILLFIISVTNKIYASAWLIDSGKYKYTVTASNIDKNSKNIKQVRANLFLQIQCKLAYLKDRIKLVNNSSALYNKLFRQIQFLERRSREISSYQDELMRIFAIEYGINKNQNLGIQLLYKENKFQGSNDMNYLSNDKEIGIFYKIKLFQNTNKIVSVQPRIYMTKDGCQQQFSYELLLLSAFSKKIRTVSVFAESVFSFGQALNNSYTRRSHYSFSISEGIEFQNGIMLVDFTKYYTRRNYGSIYNRTLYKQFSVAKRIKFGNLKKNSLTTQIGYFCDKSLINKHYKISGVIFSIWMDV
ncbi:hypothetical protein [Candidatus Tisiphia endosymbiont of Oplodontha viridula]|uniref:hypothetical protein n=1 Tax=Candidatus Tisiphia endosymbiont of Oplodontha viridula TaxID=3077925 RepID=UPI0035C89B3B